MRWVAKPTEKNVRKSEKSNKRELDLAKITKFLKFVHSKTLDLASKPIENLAPDLGRGLFGYIAGADFGRKIWPWDKSLFRIIWGTENHGFWGGSVSNRHLEIQVFRGCPTSPTQPHSAPLIHVNGRRSEPGNTRLS